MKIRTKGINRKKTSWLLGQDLDVKITALQINLLDYLMKGYDREY